MIEPEETDRWRTLAEELGLPPEPEQPPASRSAAARSQEAPTREPVESTVEAEALEPPPERPEEASVRGRRRRGQPSSPNARLEAAREEPTGGPVGCGEESTESAETPPASVPSEERPQRGRRRRRGGKPHAPAEAPASAEETTAGDTGDSPAETGAERPLRRRRRRGTAVEAESESPPADETEEEETEVVGGGSRLRAGRGCRRRGRGFLDLERALVGRDHRRPLPSRPLTQSPEF